MIERQRLEMEKDLAVARRALYRCQHVAQDGAYYGIEDALTPIIAATAALMEALMQGKELPKGQLTFCE